MALFIGRLPHNVDTRDLEDIFGKYGRITRCDIKRGTGNFNFGFVEFEERRDAEDAKRASEQRDFTYRGERIVVEWAKGANRSARPEDCFKCGRSGHWARDCSDSRGSRRRSRSPPRRRSPSPRDRRRDRSRSRSPSVRRRRSPSPAPRRDRDYDDRRGREERDRSRTRSPVRRDSNNDRDSSPVVIRRDRDDSPVGRA